MNALATVDPGFWDRIAPGYAKKKVPDEQAYMQTLDRVRTYLKPTDRVLEFGCGTGTTALHLASSARSIFATDVSPGMISIARDKAEKQGGENVEFGVHTLFDSALDSALDAGRFDVVMGFNILHLLEDVPAAAARARELLEPGGLFISKTGCVGEMGVLVKMAITVMQGIGKAPFINYVKRDELLADIEHAGFEIVESGYFAKKTNDFFVVARKI